MNLKCGLLVLSMLAGLASFSLSAQEAGDTTAQKKTSPLFQKETEPRSYGNFQAFYSLYYPNNNKSAWDDVFKKDYIEPFGISFGAYPVRNLGINIFSAYSQREGHAVSTTSGASSGEKVTLTVVPVELEVDYRFDFVDEQFIVPVVGAGGDYWYYKEDNEFHKDVTGWKSGYHAMAGVGILLDRIDPTSRGSLEEYGIENVFLEIEARWNWLNSDHGLDFTGAGYSAGLLFEF